MSDPLSLEQPLPNGWLVQFFAKADLDGSFNALQGYEHFYAYTFRGCIRSLQLRTREAERYFTRATQLSMKSKATIPNAVRQFLLAVYKVENRLLEAPLEDDLDHPKMLIPEVSERLTKEYPEVRLIIDLRLAAEALVRLHTGDIEESSRIYRELIARNEKGPEDVLVMYYLGLAASEHNLGLVDSAKARFEDAGFCISVGGKLLNRVRAAGCLSAFYEYLGYDDEASEWKEFIGRLNCPEETKSVFLKRGALQVERCAQESRLLLI